MFGLTKLSSAVRSLADNLLALAGTVAEVNGGLRLRLCLDAAEGDAPAAKVIDNAAAATPEALPGPRGGRGRKATA
jgi:hypothetical protein